MLRRLVACSLLIGSTAAAQASSRAEIVARLDSLARAHVAAEPAAGLTAAVIRGRDTLLFGGYGEQDRERHIPADRATVYRIGSITKQFTSAAIFKHIEAGHLKLTDTLGALLPEYPAWKHVTLRQLLNHTSGIHSYTSSAGWRASMTKNATPAQVMDFVRNDTFDFAPGTAWRYNNSGYFLLGMILEKLEKKPYAEIMRERFFRPLGMKTADYCPNVPQDPRYATGYDRRGASLVLTQPIDLSHPFSAGALCMSVPDFLAWQTALTSGKVVTPASYAAMTTSDTLVNGKRTGYGFGLAPAMLGSHALIQHGGDIPGFSTQQLWFPDDSLRVVVFANTLGSNPDRLARNLAAAIFGMPLTSKAALPTAVVLPPGERAKYEGRYLLALPNDRTLPLRIFIEGDALMSQAEGPGQGKVPLVFLGNDTFGASFDPALRLTFIVENGRAAKVRLLQNGATVEGPRDATP